MSNLVRWNPSEEVTSLQRAVDRLFEESFVRPWWGREAGMPLDMYETENEVVVQLSIPGVKPEDLEVSVRGDVLTISGETKGEKDVEGRDYHYRERRYGKFSRSVGLPTAIQVEKTKAVFEQGVLTLTAPKAEESKPKSVEVKIK